MNVATRAAEERDRLSRHPRAPTENEKLAWVLVQMLAFGVLCVLVDGLACGTPFDVGFPVCTLVFVVSNLWYGGQYVYERYGY